MLAKIYDISSLSPLAKHMGEDMTWPLQSICVWDVCSVFPVLAVDSIMHMVVFFNCFFSPVRFLLKIFFLKFSFSLMKDAFAFDRLFF